ncbi:KGGVGR-motif variant AAA ATPase [Streptomyces sp. WAC 06783]|uniref:KGGVGR-motif variant AAA ATPase n=1 Tax=Streptomyces sp. WAC 06783 TaxID=2203211 RepID=UPI0021AD864D|nr:AAA family ATPase [Streptomyces sp. WAC 06783]
MTFPPDPVRFDRARTLALASARELAASGVDVLVVRDLLGRVSLLLDDRLTDISDGTVAHWTAHFSSSLGPYAPQRPVLLASRLFRPSALLDSPRVVDDLGAPSAPRAGRVRLLDNIVVGEEWTRVRELTESDQSTAPRTARTALYGFKGGVGRSTATYMLARRLADLGRCVLVIDLDLESPGVGPLLVTEEQFPAYGLVDHLVESAVGNADGLDLVVPASHLPSHNNGELWVAPARGLGAPDVPYSYVDKLNRVYADSPSTEFPAFADRLESAVAACEKAVAVRSRHPDVVLLDSRAGIHDIAAVAISRLCDLALLFASDNTQTWKGYRDLFTAWRDAGQAVAVRERLRMVASMVPDSPDHPLDTYLESFRDHAWSCFSILYDDLPADAPSDGGDRLWQDKLPVFNPSPEDDSAPHSPIPILFTLELVGLDAINTPGWDERAFVRAAYDAFLDTATRLILEGR